MSFVLNAVQIKTPTGAPLFAPVTMVIAPGQIGTVMGPSGIGKSTLLDALAGHLAHGFRCDGDIILNGQRLNMLPAEARHLGIMFQDAALFPHLSVGDNLAFGLSARLKTRTARRERVEQALQVAGLGGMMQRDPATLSGGERARAALMRTLLAEPRAVLLDEPFSKLDTGLRAEMRAFTFQHIRASAIPALMVTHDMDDALAAEGQVVHLDARPRAEG
jgi:putative thiamine transport system ATP-binding protein